MADIALADTLPTGGFVRTKPGSRPRPLSTAEIRNLTLDIRAGMEEELEPPAEKPHPVTIDVVSDPPATIDAPPQALPAPAAETSAPVVEKPSDLSNVAILTLAHEIKAGLEAELAPAATTAEVVERQAEGPTTTSTPPAPKVPKVEPQPPAIGTPTPPVVSSVMTDARIPGLDPARHKPYVFKPGDPAALATKKSTKPPEDPIPLTLRRGFKEDGGENDIWRRLARILRRGKSKSKRPVRHNSAGTSESLPPASTPEPHAAEPEVVGDRTAPVTEQPAPTEARADPPAEPRKSLGKRIDGYEGSNRSWLAIMTGISVTMSVIVLVVGLYIDHQLPRERIIDRVTEKVTVVGDDVASWFIATAKGMKELADQMGQALSQNHDVDGKVNDLTSGQAKLKAEIDTRLNELGSGQAALKSEVSGKLATPAPASPVDAATRAQLDKTLAEMRERLEKNKEFFK